MTNRDRQPDLMSYEKLFVVIFSADDLNSPLECNPEKTITLKTFIVNHYYSKDLDYIAAFFSMQTALQYAFHMCEMCKYDFQGRCYLLTLNMEFLHHDKKLLMSGHNFANQRVRNLHISHSLKTIVHHLPVFIFTNTIPFQAISHEETYILLDAQWIKLKTSRLEDGKYDYSIPNFLDNIFIGCSNCLMPLIFNF